MAAQPYHQRAGGSSGDARQEAGAGGIAVPGALRCLVVALVLLVILLAALPVLMAVDPGMTVASIRRNDPSLGPADLEFALAGAIALAAITHVIYAAIVVWLGVTTVRGRRWARIALTVVMVAATVNSLDSMLAGPEYLWWAIAGDVIHVGVIGLLWLPKPVRDFFALHRARAVGAGATGSAF